MAEANQILTDLSDRSASTASSPATPFRCASSSTTGTPRPSSPPGRGRRSPRTTRPPTARSSSRAAPPRGSGRAGMCTPRSPCTRRAATPRAGPRRARCPAGSPSATTRADLSTSSPRPLAGGFRMSGGTLGRSRRRTSSSGPSTSARRGFLEGIAAAALAHDYEALTGRPFPVQPVQPVPAHVPGGPAPNADAADVALAQSMRDCSPPGGCDGAATDTRPGRPRPR